MTARFRALKALPIGCAALLLAVGASSPAGADTFTPLASYEPGETDLIVTAAASDAGLTISRVPGGASGAPAATDGAYVLKVQITNEADRKVEFRHDWLTGVYDLAGNVELLADVYIASSGALPGLMGIWSPNWQPPDAWQQATNIPTSVGSWQTIRLDVSQREQFNLNYIYAFIFENLAGTSGVAYVDNLRLRALSGPQPPQGACAVGYDGYNEVVWSPVSALGMNGYHVYRSAAAGGPFARITAAPTSGVRYRDAVGAAAPRYFYTVSSVIDGIESPQSAPASALYNGLSDTALLDEVQERTFQYFWAGGHPHSGMAREGIGLGHPLDTVTVGGTGFGLMAIVVGAERNFVSRADAALRVRRILRFLDGVNPDNPALPSGVQRYHGAWAHHYHGVTGATIAFTGPADNGGDLVETGFLVQGLLTVRQYFDGGDAVESEIRARATSMWESVEWSWYRRFPTNQFLYWHWSPNFGWQMNLPIRGHNETMVVYLLAIASPTFSMPASSYYQGYAGLPGYANPNSYYGYRQWVGEPLGGPLFFTHYSNLGFDPRYKRDAYCNYFANARNTSLINRMHCIQNPGGYVGYGPLTWGLTASNNPWGYLAHSPTSDNGTIAPTAALSAMPFIPAESLETLRHLYDAYGFAAYGAYGFVDAFNLGEGWFAPGYLAIDQGPIVVMIENYRSGLCWKLFMQNPEIGPALTAMGFRYEIDFDLDGDVDGADLAIFTQSLAGPGVTTPPSGVTSAQFAESDLDDDGDVDAADAAVTQTLPLGP